MTYTSKKERGTSARSSLLTLIVVMLVSLFAVGCGDSGEDFVVTGNNGNAVPTGNVTFQFAKAQNIATVPAATTQLIFEFLDASGARTGNGATVNFANTVTLAVPTSAARAVVRATNAQGATIATVNFTFTVLANQTVTAVVAGGGTTGTTTGNTTGTTTGNTTGSTTGNTTGSTTGNTTGSTTGNTTGSTTGNTTGGTPEHIEVSVGGLNNPSTLKMNTTAASTSGVITVRYFAANSTTGTALPAGAFTTQFQNTSPNTFVPAFTAATQVITNTLGSTPGATTSFIVDYVTPGGAALRDTIAVTTTGVDSTDVVAAQVVTLNTGGNRLVAHTTGVVTYPVMLKETLASGAFQRSVAFGAAANQYSVTSSNPAVATVNPATGLITPIASATGGTTNIVVSRNAPFGSTTLSPTPIGTFPLTVAPQTVTLAATANVTLSAPGTVRRNEIANYTVRLNYSDGTSQDITATQTVTTAAPLQILTAVDFSTTLWLGTFRNTATGSGTLNLGAAANGLATTTTPTFLPGTNATVVVNP